MNRADVALLNSQLDELGNAFLRNRQMDAEKKYRDQEANAATMRASADLEFRKAQQAHYNQVDDKQAEAEKLRSDQEAVKQKQGLLQSIVALNATGQLTDDARDDFNGFLADDPHYGPTGIQIQPPDPSKMKGANKDSAIVNVLKQAALYRQQAEQADNDEDAKRFTDYADKLERAADKEGQFKPAQGFEETTTTPTVDPITGKQTGTAVKTKRRTPTAAPAAGPATDPAAATAPVAPADATQLVKGRRYRSAKNPTVTGVWTGSAFQTDAPQQQVTGFGAAQPPGQ